MDRRKQAETFAEAFAVSYLKDTFGKDFFIGSYIESLLAKKVHIIYQYVEDKEYYGAAVMHQDGEKFIALNTFHPLRMRYYTAAHEIWHLSEESKMQDKDFDHERAADRFAAAIMLPKSLTKELWNKFDKQHCPEESVIHIADLAAVPYKTVVRRLIELGIKLGTNIQRITEEEWLNKRSEFNFPDSFLDKAHPDTRFADYERIVTKSVEQNSLDPLTAANKLSKFAPHQSAKYQKFLRDTGEFRDDDET